MSSISPPIMQTRPPFLIIPWENDAIQSLLTHCLDTSESTTKLGDVAIIFMHDRPRRYMLDAIRSSENVQKPCLLPNILTFQECVQIIRAHLTVQNTPLRTLNPLDQIALLERCTRSLSIQDTHNALAKLPQMDSASFFPWGHYLAELMETCFTQDITPHDIHHTEYDVAPFAAALLETLGNIFADYTKNLEDNALTTPAYDMFCVANILKDAFTDSDYIPNILRHKHIFIVANYALSGAEEHICRYFWEHGARICLHTDPKLADPKESNNAHYAVASHKQWIQRWQADVMLAEEPQKRTTKLHFFAGHDLHSQLATLKDDLQASKATDPSHNTAYIQSGSKQGKRVSPQTHNVSPQVYNDSAQAEVAIILTNANCLMPLLHTLPDKNCNISIGYPLDHSLIMQLITTLLDIRTTRREDGTVACVSLLNWCRHPYIRALTTKDGTHLQDLLKVTEKKLLEGKPYIDANNLLAYVLQNSTAANAIKELYTHCFTTMLINWGKSTNTYTLGTALAHTCDILLTAGAKLWEHFPLDAECLYRLTNSIITYLKISDIAHTDLPWQLLQSILIDLIQKERVPFEADPLTGLQVLGMLETRFLRLRRVYILDLTDDALPGSLDRNPLLPDSLRATLGLPDAHVRDQVAAYTFTRLLKGADEAFLYWQESTQTSALFDGKKVRSRFIEERIWEAEQKAGKIFTTGQAPLRTAPFIIKPSQNHAQAILKSPALKDVMRTYLTSQNISATALNMYIACPAKFFYTRLCSIKTQEKLADGYDLMGTGQLIHEILEDFLTPYLNKTFLADDVDATIIRGYLDKSLAKSLVRHTLSPENLAMLQCTIPQRLERALRNITEPCHIKHLEYPIKTSLAYLPHLNFYGKLDRVDTRSEGLHILDYKTGKSQAVSANTWNDSSFFEALQEACNLLDQYKYTNTSLADASAEDTLPLLREYIPNIQLYLYAALYEAKHQIMPYDVANLDLHNTGQELSIFHSDIPYHERKESLGILLPLLFQFCVKHMESFPYFIPNQDTHCDWCFIKKSCTMAKH